MFYSINWERVPFKKNIIKVYITFLDETGHQFQKVKYYEEWMGVCTNHIDSIVAQFKFHFPGHKVCYQSLGPTQKILPYFNDRLASGKLENTPKTFYKLYTSACLKDVGQFFHLYKMSYFLPEDWLVRLYIDLGTLYKTHSFYYMWYRVNDRYDGLMDSLELVSERTEPPDWTVAAFDLETVPLQGNHIPTGYDPLDRIVMISLYKWNRRQGLRTWLLYLLPPGLTQPLSQYVYGFQNELDMLKRFHTLIDDAQILTGYNINAFDFPCLFARLFWLKCDSLLKDYTSQKIGADSVITTYKRKIVLDLYPYFKTFSGYDLPSFKLDDVARVKLKGKSKIDVKSIGIWYWYRGQARDPSVYEDTDIFSCMRHVQPPFSPSEFGSFPLYLDYCLRDSELVYELFEKEHVLSFLVQRANFTAITMIQALHYGSSQYLTELFKTYGTRLGYFMNPAFFKSDFSIYQQVLGNDKTYQGALNYCIPETFHEDVSIMDFASMYPSVILSSNLCYSTCTILPINEWLTCPVAQQHCVAIPFRKHSDRDFTTSLTELGETFAYPQVDPARDSFVIVINPHLAAFLPNIIENIVQLRKYHQDAYKVAGDVYHFISQLNLKILANSLYGVMATLGSTLEYIPIAMTITNNARNQLIGAHQFIEQKLKYRVVYDDTDSVMVVKWPLKNCDAVNAFLNLPYVELKYERHVTRFLVLSKKKYIYETDSGALVTKCFQKKMNALAKGMCHRILQPVWDALKNGGGTASQGWILWVDTVLEANYLCRNPKQFSIYRKIKKLEDYKSKACPSVKFLKKYPDKVDEHVEMTYNRVDVSAKESTNWIVSVDDCQYVNYEQLFVNQKKTLCTLLNMGFWHLPHPVEAADMVLNAIHWKRFMHAELIHWHQTKRHLKLLVVPGVKYTFTINDHIQKKRGEKRKIMG